MRFLLFSAVGFGAALGLIFTLCEDLLNLKSFIFYRFEEPLGISVGVLLIDVLLGGAAGLAASPWLFRRGLSRAAAIRRHRLTTYGLFALVILLTPTEMEVRHIIDVMLLAATALLTFLAVRWCRSKRRRVVAAALALFTIWACGELPGWWAVWSLESSEHAETGDAESGDAEVAAAASAPANAPNVLFVVLDTVRNDRTGLAGYERDTLPSLAHLADEGVSFERAVSPAGWTVPSHASMFTGLYPSAHRAHHEHTYLGRSFETLAEHFANHGWSTVAITSNPWISETSGLAQGFEQTIPVGAYGMAPAFSFAYRLLWSLGFTENDHGGRQAAHHWREWLDLHASHEPDRPFFAFLNLVESHMPYHKIPREHLTRFTDGRQVADLNASSKAVTKRIMAGQPLADADTVLTDLSNVYDGALSYVDVLLTRILLALKEDGYDDDTLVVVVSDHGDHLGERGMLHHTRGLTEQVLSVPLVLRFPGRLPAGTVVSKPVSTAALMPTVLELASLPIPKNLQAKSLVPLLRGDPNPPHSPLLAEQYRDQHKVFGDWQPTHPFDRLGMRWRSLEENGWKLVVSSEDEDWLFRPRDDPQELHDLSDEHPEIAERLHQHLDALEAAYRLGALDRDLDVSSEDVPVMDEETLEQLRELGYL